MTPADPDEPPQRPAPRLRPRSSVGSVTAWMMIVPLLVLVLGGMAVDMWSVLSIRSRMAAVADDAASAGATAVDPALLRGGMPMLDPGTARARALAAVDAHPDRDSITSRVATASPDQVEVTVAGTADLTLLRLVGTSSMDLRVSGAAAPRVRTGP